MPSMSRSYCKNTPIKNMGFSQRSSCKAKGIIPRTSRKQKGKFVVSLKYKRHSIKKNSNSSLFKKRYKKLSKLRKNPRVPRQSKNESSRHHSDLFVDENPKGTVHGMRFKDSKSAKKSISKLKKLYKTKKISYAHMRQIGVTMEQRSRFHSHPTKDIKQANKIWKQFNNSFK
jgi:hypothetical protein